MVALPPSARASTSEESRTALPSSAGNSRKPTCSSIAHVRSWPPRPRRVPSGRWRTPVTEAYQSHTADAATYLLTRGTGPYGRCRPSSSSPGLHLAIWSHFPRVISLPIGRNIPAFSSHRAFNVSSSSMGSGVRTSPTTRELAAPSKTASGIPPLRPSRIQHLLGAGLL